MLIYNLHYETRTDGRPFPVLTVEGEQAPVRIERAGSDRLMKFPLYAYNEENKQNFIVRWCFDILEEEDKDDFILFFNEIAPYFKVIGANIDDDGNTISASGIASCSEEELLEFFTND